MLKEKIKSIMKTGDGKNNKNLENAVVFIIILIVTIIIINTIWGNEEKTQKDVTQDNNAKMVSTETEEKIVEGDVEKNIKQILSKINGVGKVDVLITYSETSQVIAMYNESYKESQTEEGDTSGGTRTIQEVNKEKEIIYKEEDGEKVPITEKVIMPKMEGALIVAEGVNNATVKANVIQAVEALTGLQTHKIQVLEMKSNI